MTVTITGINHDQHVASDDRFVVWFDIDNTLYSENSKISQAMSERIHAYFITLGLSENAASELHLKYYTQYGLALRGLARHHHIDPLDFDRNCDGSLPLEQMIRPNPSLRKLLQDIDRSKARVWALTNAYRPHAQRVLRILNLEDQIEDIVYCDYQEPNFTCKPETEYYLNALKKAGLSDPSKCLFVDDNRGNVDAAKALGWGGCVHFCEHKLKRVGSPRMRQVGNEGRMSADDTGVAVISDLEELREVWPHIFTKGE